jgi:phosphonate transport system substrate-binding protein
MKFNCINFLLVTGLLVSCSKDSENNDILSNNNHSFSVESINIALKPNKNVQAQREDEVTLGKSISKRLGIPVNISTPASKSIIEAGLANKTIDIGYVSSSDAISFADNEVAEILVAGQHESFDTEGKPYIGSYYYSVWLSLKNKPYNSISDLKGKPIAFASRTSTSGFLIPAWDIVKKKLIPENGSLNDYFGEGNIFYGTGYVSAVEQVLEGKAEAAAVSYYVFEKDKHLTKEQRSKLKIIQRQGPVASHTFCVRSSLPENDREMLKNTLLKIAKEEPMLSQSLFGGTLTGVDPVNHLKAPREAKMMVSKLSN